MYSGAMNDYFSRKPEQKHWTLDDAFQYSLEQEARQKVLQLDWSDLYPQNKGQLTFDDTSIILETPQKGTSDLGRFRLSYPALIQIADRAGVKAAESNFPAMSKFPELVRDSIVAPLSDSQRKADSFYRGASSMLVEYDHDGMGTIREIQASNHVYLPVSKLIRGLKPWIDSRGGQWRVTPVRDQHHPLSRIATESDVLGDLAHPYGGVKVGDRIEPSIYASDVDFGILVADMDSRHDGKSHVIHISHNIHGMLLIRAMMAEYVCGNLGVHGETLLSEIRMRHTATQIGAMNPSIAGLDRWYGMATNAIEDHTADLAEITLGQTTREAAEASYSIAKQAGVHNVLGAGIWSQISLAGRDQDSTLGTTTDVTKANGMMQAGTWWSQRQPYSGDRHAVDTALGRWAWQAIGKEAIDRKKPTDIGTIGLQAMLGAD